MFGCIFSPLGSVLSLPLHNAITFNYAVAFMRRLQGGVMKIWREFIWTELSPPPLITVLSVFQNVELQSLWKDQPVVLFFLRRFGCQICRWTAAEISKLEPDLRAGGIALVGVGPEEFGLTEFKDGGFFKGCKAKDHFTKHLLFLWNLFMRPRQSSFT